MKISRRFFLISLSVMAGVLIVYGILRWKFGAFLPAAVDKNLPDAIMFAAVAIMLVSRKQRSDEAKAAAAAEAERKRLEEEAAEARQVVAEDTAPEDTVAEDAAEDGGAADRAPASKTGDGERGADAPG
jgi:hypothetical protein